MLDSLLRLWPLQEQAWAHPLDNERPPVLVIACCGTNYHPTRQHRDVFMTSLFLGIRNQGWAGLQAWGSSPGCTGAQPGPKL